MSKKNIKNYLNPEQKETSQARSVFKEKIEKILDEIIVRTVIGEREVLDYMVKIISYAEKRGLRMKGYRSIYDELREGREALPNFSGEDLEQDSINLKKIIRDSD